MKAAKTQKHLKKYLIHQKKLLKRKQNTTPAKTNAPISQTSSECLKSTIQIHQMRNKKNLK